MRALTLFLVTVVCALAGSRPASAQTPPPPPPGGAATELRKADGSSAGSVVMIAENGVVHVRARLSGLPSGFHGFHVHTAGSCVPPAFTSAGGHFNPTGAVHPNHAGDMPLLYVAGDGAAFTSFETDRFTIAQLFDADGSAIVVHASPDNHAHIPADRYDPDPDTTTLATGDAGSRLACGVLSPQGTAPIAPVTTAAVRADMRATTGAAAGFVVLREEGGKVRVSGELTGLTSGFHGFHVHEVGRCEAPAFTSAGGHLNPSGASHPGHTGDVPVLYAGRDGTASMDFTTDRFRMGDVIDLNGSAIIVHASPDNYANIPTDRYDPDPDATTLATGDAGARVLWGVPSTLTPCELEAAPRRARAGQRAAIGIRAADPRRGAPLARAYVEVRGAGVARTVRTSAAGTARAVVRPRRRGSLRLSIAPSLETRGCRANVRVFPRRGTRDGIALTGRAIRDG